MSDILLFAAGSLRLAFAPLLSAFQRRAGQKVTAEFGPAGLLRQRIENGKRPQLFASANVAHPQRLVDLVPSLTERPLPQVLFDPHWRLATSTPGADPSGDYALQLFERCEQYWPGQGEALRRRALPLVGGRDSAPVPAGRLAAEYLIAGGQADIFLGYASYAPALAAYPTLAVRPLAPPLDIEADYGLCLLDDGAQRLAAFILSEQGQEILSRHGFMRRAE